jgi:hypothetical protein
MQEAYRRLQLPPHSDLVTAKAQFRALSKRMHPDLFVLPADRLAATARFQEIAEAFQFLSQNYVAPTADDLARGPAAKGPAAPPTTVHVFDPEPFQAADLIGMLTDWWEGFEFVLMLLMWPLLIAWGFSLTIVAVLPKGLSTYPRLEHLTFALLARWAPCIVVAWTGISMLANSDSWVWWYFLASGVFYGVLEILAHLIAIAQLRGARARLINALVGTDGEGRQSYAALLRALAP